MLQVEISNTFRPDEHKIIYIYTFSLDKVCDRLYKLSLRLFENIHNLHWFASVNTTNDAWSKCLEKDSIMLKSKVELPNLLSNATFS